MTTVSPKLTNFTSRVPEDARFGQVAGFHLLVAGARKPDHGDGSTGCDEVFLHGLLLVAVVTEPLLPLATLQDDVDVSGDQLRDLLPLGGLFI